MQAVILAAGMGSRLGEMTSEIPKCMVEVNGTSLIDRLLSQLSPLGLTRVIIVTGYKADTLKRHLADRYSSCLPIEYIDNPEYASSNNIWSLALASNELCKDDTMLIESDLIFSDGILQGLSGHEGDAIALIAEYSSWMDGTMVQLTAAPCTKSEPATKQTGGNSVAFSSSPIVRFIPKAQFDENEADTYYKTVNVYKFSSSFSSGILVPALKKHIEKNGRNEYYETVLGDITEAHSAPILGLDIADSAWYEIDDANDLNSATQLFL